MGRATIARSSRAGCGALSGVMIPGFMSIVAPNESLRSRDQLRLLAEVAQAIASHSDLTDLFRDLARRLPGIVPFEVIALFLHDPEKNVLRVHMIGTADADSSTPFRFLRLLAAPFRRRRAANRAELLPAPAHDDEPSAAEQ